MATSSPVKPRANLPTNGGVSEDEDAADRSGARAADDLAFDIAAFGGGMLAMPMADGTEHDFLDNGSDFLQLDPDSGDGGTIDGSWVRLATEGSTMPNGTLLAYTTDLDGNLIGRDGQVTTILDDTVRAQVGWVQQDASLGTDPLLFLMFSGEQSVFLPVGRQLHFAVQTGDDVIEPLPDVQIDVHPTAPRFRRVTVDGTFGTLDLLASVDNERAPNALLAGSQRAHNLPLVYLEQNQQILVEAKGSAWNWNTIHFVRIDLDEATGGWSVGGEAYGDTEAFRAAVQASWAPDVELSGGRGNFEQGLDWTVSTGAGFYAPVLATEDGDIFVLGDANVDGRDHIRMFSENTFGFEDLRADQDCDFDYNDMVVKLHDFGVSLGADAPTGGAAFRMPLPDTF